MPSVLVSRTAPVRLTAPSRLTVGASAVQGSALPCHSVVIKALCPGQIIYVGVSSGVTTATGFPLLDGDVIEFQVSNVNLLWFIASAAAQSVALMPYALY